MPAATATREHPRLRRRILTPAVNGIPSMSTGHDRSSYITSAAMLADLLQPHIDTLNLELACGDEKAADRGAGAIDIISGRAAAMLRRTPDAVVRRFAAIRHGETRATTCELADALLDALDLMIEHTDLPTFPGGMVSALEMVDIYHERHPEPLPEFERRRLARQLLRFTLGFLADNSSEPLPDTEDWARVVARTRLRRSQQKLAGIHANTHRQLAA